MKKIFIAMNDCYGGHCSRLKREYNSIEEFDKDWLDAIESHPISTLCSSPVLVEIDLADDETYEIDDYDGLESLSIRKIVQPELTSKVISKHVPE